MLPAVAPLETTAQVRSLSADQASAGVRVELDGVVTFYSPKLAGVFFQDKTGGIYIEAPRNLAVKTGDHIAVSGVTAPGFFAPTVSRPTFRILGTSSLPHPRIIEERDLRSGLYDSQFVEVGGIVRRNLHIYDTELAIDKNTLEIDTGSGLLEVLVANGSPEDLRKLPDSEITVKGACGGVFNGRGQMTGIRIYITSLAQVDVTRPAPADPFSLPERPIPELTRLHPGDRPGHRVHVRGTVAAFDPGRSIALQHRKQGILVLTRFKEPIMPGEEVEVTGFPERIQGLIGLTDALVRRTKVKRELRAAETTVELAEQGEYANMLVRIRGRVVEKTRTPWGWNFVLETGDHLFLANYPRKSTDPRLDIPPGSLVRVTGVCQPVLSQLGEGELDSGAGHAERFQLPLRTPADIEVVELPSWWTLTHALFAFTLASLLASAVIVWVIVLRRRIKRQMRYLERQLRQEAALERKYRNFVENASDIIFSQDLEGKYTFVNSRAEEVTGYSREELLTMSMYDLVVPAGHATVNSLLKPTASLNVSSEDRAVSLDVTTKYGRVVTIELTARPVIEGGIPVGLEGIARDVTERRGIELMERDRNAVLEMVGRLEPLPEILQRIVRMAERQSPGSAGALLLRRSDAVMVAAGDSLPGDLRKALDGSQTQELPIDNRDGHWVHYFDLKEIWTVCRSLGERALGYALQQSGYRACWISPVYAGPGELVGNLSLYLWIPVRPKPGDSKLMETCCHLAGIAIEHHQLHDQLTQQSRQDNLTGLPNRIVFRDRLEQALLRAQREKTCAGVVFIDLDGFKQINDTWGHETGDRFLQAVAARLKTCLRESDTLARMGGDEFTAVLPNLVEPENANDVAETLISSLDEPFLIDNYRILGHASIGVSVFPRDGETAADLQKAADVAMYEAKRAGKNQYRSFRHIQKPELVGINPS